MTFRWTKENMDIAAEMWKRASSATVIGIEIGCSRNAVLSKADRHRDIFPERKERGTSYVDTSKLFDTKAKEHLFDSSVFAIPDTKPVRFVDLESHHCKFPVSNDHGADMLCCGGEKTHGSYCATHAAVCRGSGTLSEQRAISGRVAR